jgi:hypothetical protein
MLRTETFRRLAAAGIDRAVVDAVARSLGSPPKQLPFAVILAALAGRLEAQAEAARTLAADWQGWDARVLVLEMEGDARALVLETEGGRP